MLGSRIGLRAVVLGVTLALSSTALGYFTTSGSGGGSAALASTQAITLSPGTPSAQLYPGGQGSVAATIDNPNPIGVHIGTLSLSTGQGTAGYAVDAGHSACSTSALSFTAQTNAGAGWTVPPKVGSVDGALAIDLIGSLALAGSSSNVCQGATFTVYLTAGP
jgi:hypothetical protein